jgi:hypothetical protein
VKPDVSSSKTLAKKARVAVSAEVFGKHNKRESYMPTIVKKAPAV